jgi:hypothetical protein
MALQLTIMIPSHLLRLQSQLPLMRHLPSRSPLLLGRHSALLKSSWKHLHRLEVSPISPDHRHRLKTRRGASVSCLRIVSVPVYSTVPSQRRPACPVRGPQHLRLYVRRLPSRLQLHSHHLSYHAHDQIRFLRLPLPMDNRLPYHSLPRCPARAHCPYEHLHHQGAGFRRLVHFVGKA